MMKNPDNENPALIPCIKSERAVGNNHHAFLGAQPEKRDYSSRIL